MVFSQIIIKPFYALAFRFLNILRKREEIVFYCHTPVDMENWLPVQKHLLPIPICTDKSATYKALKQQGYQVKRLPVFPKAVIMCRVSAHKFPSAKVTKIGMTHGAYHFKKFSAAKHYAPFSLYLFTSQQDLENAVKHGIRCGKVGGFPKLDPYLRAEAEPKLDSGRPKLLFTATYDSSNMSAISRWIDRLPELCRDYQVFVSVHPWTNPHFKARLKTMKDIHYIEESPLPYIKNADLCIVDSSSIIAECSALDKPMISWEIAPARRSRPEIDQIIRSISIRVRDFDDLPKAIEQALANPSEFAAQRQKANAIFFDCLDGSAGLRAAHEIANILPEVKP